jgi:hypothetical protein
VVLKLCPPIVVEKQQLRKAEGKDSPGFIAGISSPISFVALEHF